MTMEYFAYASNMAEDVMAEKAPDHRLLGVASLDGYRLELTRRSIRSGMGVADIVLDPHGHVWGVLYELSHDDVAALDRKEGLGWAYTHLNVPVVLREDGSVHDALTYTVVTKEPEPVPASDEYLRRLIAAARSRALPEDYVEFLAALPSAEADAVGERRA